ncbi:GDYXXLXY domain-containing protein [Marinoscillum sp.]|uniref:GDYXXLXY domain-containing protein n=1 Tax=Marinoscillum sp. TaxID=2024838 RepID=UPI003BA9BCE6
MSSTKKTLISAFICVALIQLYVPARMIWDREQVLTLGKEYLFETAPIDPTDPFRGKYIQLNFEAANYPIEDKDDWTNGASIYLTFSENGDGLAEIETVSKKKPVDTPYFLKAKVDYVTYDDVLMITYPFERFYMEESKAYEAEQQYNLSVQGDTTLTYAVVHIMEGSAVLKDVRINNISIQEWVERSRSEKE